MNQPVDNRLLKPPAGGPRLHQRRSLQEANEVSLQLSGNQLHVSSDPRGRRLRALRQAQGLNPSEVATEACISLGQLYELETGGERLFYSTTLRQQAGRRVAQLLGADWDRLGDDDRTRNEADSAPAAARLGPAHAVPIQAAHLPDEHPERHPDAPAQSGDGVVADSVAAQADLSEAQAQTLAPADDTATPAAQAQGLRWLFWALVVVALGLAAARMEMIPGLRLPLA